MGITENAVLGASTRYNLHYRPGVYYPLPANHPAVLNGKTRFPKSVQDPHSEVLKPGSYQRKLGREVTKGAWKGSPIFSLTLEERATCPATCAMWQGCYGNQMHRSVRYRHGRPLEDALRANLRRLISEHGRLVVRLHILGDFYSVGYVYFWEEMLDRHPGLNVFGYTAWDTHTRIGEAIKDLRYRRWDRFAVRTSSGKHGWTPKTIVIERAEDKPPEAIICPAQIEKTQSCGTCGLCWSPAAKQRTIAFLRH